MTGLVQDFRYAARSLLRAPGFTAVVVLTLALAIGANTAVFSVANAVLLRPLPFPASNRLVRLYETFRTPDGQEDQGSLSVPNYRDWSEQSRSLAEITAYARTDINLQGRTGAHRLSAVEASANLFSVLGSPPLFGRTFAPGEDESGAAAVVVLSEGLWRERFGADRTVIGELVILDGEAHTVVGVMPAGFRFPARGPATDAWIPLKLAPGVAENRGAHWLQAVGRLGPGATVAAARRELSEIADRLARGHPDTQEGRGASVVSLRNTVIGDARAGLLLLLGAAGLVLLIAGANTANLLLARSMAQRRNTSLRVALGAGRWRITRQFLAEALVLSAAGAAGGLVLAFWGTGILLPLAGDFLPGVAEAGSDLRVWVFVLGVMLAISAAAGAVPALAAARLRPNDELKDGGGAGTSRGTQRFRNALVSGQIALSLVLLIGAGLLAKSVVSLLRADSGMVTADVLTLNVSVDGQSYPDGDITRRFFQPALERVQAIPGVRKAGWINKLPLQEWGMNGSFGVVGASPAISNAEPFAEQRAVSPEYFAALGIPVRQGRVFSASDMAGTGSAARVILVNQALADRYLSHRDPVGRRIVLGDTFTVIGVVGSVRQAGLDHEPLPELYIPYTYFPFSSMALVASTRVPPTSITTAVRNAIRNVDPAQAIYQVQTMEQVVANTLAERRLYLWLFGTFAAVALALAVAGIYGVVSYAVAQRTREFGIRLALGAQTTSVLGLVLRTAAKLAGTGLLVGGVLALTLTHLLSSLLYGVSARDPAVLVGVSLGLAAITLLAAYLPARRATRVDPMVALRAD